MKRVKRFLEGVLLVLGMVVFGPPERRHGPEWFKEHGGEDER